MRFSKQQLDSEKDATGLITDYKDSTDPKYIGPGVWNTIHRQAYGANTPSKQQQFIIFMKDTCYNFPCTVCRGHCTEYIKNNPLEVYIGSTVDDKPLGLFIWSWKFHNAVNARLKKPIMSWNTAITLYSESNDKVCSLSCINAEGEGEEKNNTNNLGYNNNYNNLSYNNNTNNLGYNNNYNNLNNVNSYNNLNNNNLSHNNTITKSYPSTNYSNNLPKSYVPSYNVVYQY
jgi:hypothetical protein